MFLGSTYFCLAIYFISSCNVLVNGSKIPSDITSLNGKYKINLDKCPTLLNACSHLEDNLAILSCSLNTCHNNTQISAICQHKIWSYATLLLDNEFLSFNLKKSCKQEPAILDCIENESENNIDCLLKRKPTVSIHCWQMINKLESLLFNDWQIIGNFLKICQNDIEANKCGRIPSNYKSLSQVDTVKCLQSQQKLAPDCDTEITALKQMKYVSLQLDKVVFAACVMEQASFCADELPGSWLRYKCLVRHKHEAGMTKKCQDLIFYNQRLMMQNYRMSKGLVKNCKEDIRRFHCRKGVAEDKDVKMAQILLCLEGISRNNTISLGPECTAEMVEHRKMLMDDYRLSPELMHDCANDIATFCKTVETGGKIHCLMEYSRPRKRKEKRISMGCHKSLQTLIMQADPGEDWRVDPILRKACKPVVDRACKELEGGNGRVMSCLMEKLGSNVMSDECESALLQIQYFISRDFNLDPQLYKECKYDAVTQCKAKLQWAEYSDSERDLLILPCLYNYAYNSDTNGYKLKPACEQQIRRVMRQRAISVDLLPEIEDFCLDDLASLCFEHTGKGEEIQCLQQKLNSLTEKCKLAVTNFTETQSGHMELNPVVNAHCGVLVEKLCSQELKSKEDDIMDCLILHKNHPYVKANGKCRATIEHEQLIALKNYRFTRKFKNACRGYVVRFCPLAQSKSQVVTCLSEYVRNYTLTGRKSVISKDCRQQLRSQLFQQKENIDLDPELKEACEKDLSAHCVNIPHGEAAALECLQTTKAKLSNACRRALFVVKKQEFADNGVDYHLVTSCSDMIDLYCHKTESSVVFECLKAHKDEVDFNDNCKLVIINRMIEQNADYRLNNNLQHSCNTDINNFCADIIAKEPQDVELQGKVMYCLKKKFREGKLTAMCENELANILKDQALNYRLDPLLGKLCEAEIRTICFNENKSITNAHGEVEECLKKALLEHRIVSKECSQEVVQIIEETEIDIEADPLLQSACAFDLLKHCKDLEHGAGRRLKCLKIILNDETRKLEPKCHKELSNRLEMYRFVAAVSSVPVEDIGDVYNQISSSPAKKYFLILGISCVGLTFIFGLFCGRMSRRAMYVKKK